MANVYEGLNVRQKLAKARLQFLNAKVQKSGKNMKLEFKYFELDDIVPISTRIFARVGLIADMSIVDGIAKMTVYNTDADDYIEFCVPYRENEPIVNREGKQVTNNLQTLGASVTYLRRYLWMLVMEVTEPDAVDPLLEKDEDGNVTTATPTPAPAEQKPTKPATPEERAAIKEELVNQDGQASEEKVAEVKHLLKTLISKDESQKEFANKVFEKTNALQDIKESTCDSLIEQISAVLKQYEEVDNDNAED